jgi:hypothetical protein
LADKTSALSSIFKASTSQSHATDALLFNVFDNNHQANALLKASFFLTNSTQVLLRSGGQANQSLHSGLAGPVTWQHYADAGLRASLSRSHNTDALIRSVATLTHGTSSSPLNQGHIFYEDHFLSGTLDPALTIFNGTWSISGDELSQTDNTTDAHKVLWFNGDTRGGVAVEIRSKVRVDSWDGGDAARIGLSLRIDGDTGLGYDFIFYNDTNTIALSDDNSNLVTFTYPWTVGQWYWMRAYVVGGYTVYAKIWEDGESEPSEWAYEADFSSNPRGNGYYGILGGSKQGASKASGSFDALRINYPIAPELGSRNNYTNSLFKAKQSIASLTSTVISTSLFKAHSLDAFFKATFSKSQNVSLSVIEPGHIFYRNEFSGASYISQKAEVYTKLAGAIIGLGDYDELTTFNGEWSISDGILRQTSTTAEDPKKIWYNGSTRGGNAVEVKAKVRVDSWSDGDPARAGVTMRTDPTTGFGYNFVFHNDTNTLQFLDDNVAWGNSYTFPWDIGEWYWFRAYMDGYTMYARVWPESVSEPTDWPYVQDFSANPRGANYVGLNGGSSNGTSFTTVSFDSITIGVPGVPRTVLISHKINSVLRYAFTKSQLSESVLRATLSAAQNTSQLLRATFSASERSDALLKQTFANNLTTNSLLKASIVRSQATDVSLKATISAASLTQSVLRSTFTRIQQVSSNLKKGVTRLHLTSSLLKGTLSAAQSSNTLLRTTFSNSSSVNSLLRQTVRQSHTTDVLLRATPAVVHKASSLFRATNSRFSQTCALLRETFSRTNSSDALLKRLNSLDHSMCLVLKASFNLSNSIDSLFRATFDRSSLTSTILVQLFNRFSFTQSVLQETYSASQTVDVSFRASFAKISKTNLLLKDSPSRFNRFSVVISGSYTKDHDTLSLLYAVFNRSHDTRSLFKASSSKIFKTHTFLLSDEDTGYWNSTAFGDNYWTIATW